MVNPFKYGEAVTGEYFCNRIHEIRELTSCIEAAQNVFIYSNRRLGKTSLIKVVMQALATEVITIYVDVHRASSVAQFLEVYSKAISQAFLTRKEKIEKIANFFSRIIPSFEVEKDGSWRVSFDFSRTKSSVERALQEVYELPEKIAEDYKRRVVV
ncbi:MAG TPA: ATP-binding protein, partial [Candidatus Scalindua sp.]|nr:ATP-binding protein [Candidatus Scalindua sp.]